MEWALFGFFSLFGGGFGVQVFNGATRFPQFWILHYFQDVRGDFLLPNLL